MKQKPALTPAARADACVRAVNAALACRDCHLVGNAIKKLNQRLLAIESRVN